MNMKRFCDTRELITHAMSLITRSINCTWSEWHNVQVTYHVNETWQKLVNLRPLHHRDFWFSLDVPNHVHASSIVEVFFLLRNHLNLFIMMPLFWNSQSIWWSFAITLYEWRHFCSHVGGKVVNGCGHDVACITYWDNVIVYRHHWRSLWYFAPPMQYFDTVLALGTPAPVDDKHFISYRLYISILLTCLKLVFLKVMFHTFLKSSEEPKVMFHTFWKSSEEPKNSTLVMFVLEMTNTAKCFSQLISSPADSRTFSRDTCKIWTKICTLYRYVIFLTIWFKSTKIRN